MFARKLIARLSPFYFHLDVFGLLFNEGQSRINEYHLGINSPKDSCIIDFLKFNYLTIRVRVELFDNF